jgi:chemotaxis protein CheX
MELIQPFINSAAAVLAQSLGCEARIGDVSMEEEAYRRKGMAALVAISGDIEGRVIFDVDLLTASKVAGFLAGSEVETSDELVRETVFELANMVVGNAVTALNDEGVHFKIDPPQLHSADQGLSGSEDTEALVMSFNTDNGNLYMNIAMRYQHRRREDRTA